MAVIDQSSLIGTGMPKVYIKQIVLEGASGSPKERNPHIEIDSKVKTVRANQQSSPITIKVDLLLKDKIDQATAKGTWITNKKLLTYMKLEVLTTTSREIADYVIQNNTKSLQGFNSSELRDFQRSALYVDSNDDSYFRAETISILESDIVGDVAQAVAQGKRLNRTVDDAGNIVYDILYKRNFVFPDLEPEYLAVFAIADFDIDKMEQDFNVEFPPTFIAPRQLVVETIIDKSEVVSTSNVLYDGGSKVWTGPYHRMGNGGYMKGATHVEGAEILTLATVPNYKIRDTRSLRQERLQLEVPTDVEGTPFNLFDHLKDHKFNVAESSTYFTAELPARDSRGNSRFFFMFDMMKLAKERSRSWRYND